MAFYMRYSHFEYYVMLFRLFNILVIFQAYINYALVGLIDVICIVYLDNILIYLEDLEEYIGAIWSILTYLE